MDLCFFQSDGHYSLWHSPRHACLGLMISNCCETQVERDKLKLKLEKLRAGKTFEELDEDADVQVCWIFVAIRTHLIFVKWVLVLVSVHSFAHVSTVNVV